MDHKLSSSTDLSSNVSRSTDRENSFDVVRLVASLMVVYGHSFPIAGQVGPGFLGRSISTLGIEIFFVVSGYLITTSIRYDSNIFRFASKRALRIYPALVASTAFFVVLGGAVTTLPLSAYVGHPQTLEFLNNLLLKIRYNLPAVFDANPYPNAITGSWWSLPVEVTMYIVFFIVLQFGRFGLLLAIGLQALAMISVAYGHDPVIYETPLSLYTQVSIFFLLGSIFASFRSIIWTNVAIAIGLICCAAVYGNTFAGAILVPVSITYATLTVCLSANLWPWYTIRVGDLSYGIYLYGFGIQQLLAFLLPKPIDPAILFTLSSVVSAAIAFVSWHVVEKRALRLKPKRY